MASDRVVPHETSVIGRGASLFIEHGPAPLPDNPEFDVDMCICGEEWPHAGTESTEEER